MSGATWAGRLWRRAANQHPRPTAGSDTRPSVAHARGRLGLLDLRRPCRPGGFSGKRTRRVMSAGASPGPSGGRRRYRAPGSVARSASCTVDGRHIRPPLTVGTASALSPSAIARSDLPHSRSAAIRLITGSGVPRGRPNRTPAAKVRLRITHQRRRPSTDEWEDCKPFNLSRLPAGEEVSLRLSSRETLKLVEYLRWAADIADAERGPPMGRRKFQVVDGEQPVITGAPAESIAALLAEYGEDELVTALESLQSNLIEAVWAKQALDARSNALALFEQHLSADDWNESAWQSFLDENEWILGLGLSNRFLDTVKAQPPYGGGTVLGVGGSRGDDLLATAAAVRFSVLLDRGQEAIIIVSDRYGIPKRRLRDRLGPRRWHRPSTDTVSPLREGVSDRRKPRRSRIGPGHLHVPAEGHPAHWSNKPVVGQPREDADLRALEAERSQSGNHHLRRSPRSRSSHSWPIDSPADRIWTCSWGGGGGHRDLECAAHGKGEAVPATRSRSTTSTC